MGIIVANGPAVKVWYNLMSRQSFWSESWSGCLPRLKIVQNSNTHKNSILDEAPRISTLQVSGFHITQITQITQTTQTRSQAETPTTLESTELDYDCDVYGWNHVVQKYQAGSDSV
jgi:hypothetical protein